MIYKSVQSVNLSDMINYNNIIISNIKWIRTNIYARTPILLEDITHLLMIWLLGLMNIKIMYRMNSIGKESSTVPSNLTRTNCIGIWTSTKCLSFLTYSFISNIKITIIGCLMVFKTNSIIIQMSAWLKIININLSILITQLDRTLSTVILLIIN